MSSQEVEILPVKSKQGKNKKLTEEETRKILNLSISGWEVPEIAETIGRHKITVKLCLDRHAALMQNLCQVQEFENLKPQLVSAAEHKALRSLMNEEKHAKASLGQVAAAFKTLHNAGRLEKNLSTENVAKEVKYTHKIEDV